MIKTTIKSIINAKNTIGRLAGQSLPVKVSYGIARLVTAANSELSTYDAERIKLCEKYGTLSEDKTKYDITDIEAFNRDLTELVSVETELNVNRVKLTDDIRLTAQELITLEDFIEVVADD